MLYPVAGSQRLYCYLYINKFVYFQIRYVYLIDDEL